MLRKRTAAEQITSAEMRFAFDRERAAQSGYKLPSAGATPSPSESDSEAEAEYETMYGKRQRYDDEVDGHSIFGSGLNFKFIFILVLLFFAVWNIVSRAYDKSATVQNKAITDTAMPRHSSNDHSDHSYASDQSSNSFMEADEVFCNELDEPRYWVFLRLGRSIAPSYRCTSYNLAMRSSQLRDGGVHALTKGLRNMKSGKLRTLVLTNQGIGDKGASQLAKLIKSAITQPTALNVSSFSLDLRGNPIGDQGFDELQLAVEIAQRVGWMKVAVIGGGRTKNGARWEHLFSDENSEEGVENSPTVPAEWRLLSYTETENIHRPQQNPNVTIALGFGCLFLSVLFLAVFTKKGAPPPMSDRRHTVRYQ